MGEIYDAVLVGAGCAGAVFAARLAVRGYNVLILDRKDEAELGQDSCNLVESEAFEISGIPEPVAPERRPDPEKMEVVSPDTATRIEVSSRRFVLVDRRKMAARLLERATIAGARFKGRIVATGAEVERGRVVAVNTDRGSFRCRLAVGASGPDRVLCRDLPRGMGIPRRIRTSDHVSLYSETREAADGPDDRLRPGLFEYYVGRFGGYSWVNASADGYVDIGTGVQDVAGFPDPREILLGYARSSTTVGEKVVRRCGGRLPARRPMNTMAAGGLVVIGDAACQAMPVIGRGVGGAMVGASMAADAAADALDADDLSAAGLWPYNHRYMVTRGARLASLDCLRILMQKMPEKDFSWSMARGIIDEQDIAGALYGGMELPGVQFKIRKALKGFSDMPLLVRYEGMLRLMQKVQELYAQYPAEYDAADFSDWSQQADYLFEDVEKAARGV